MTTQIVSIAAPQNAKNAFRGYKPHLVVTTEVEVSWSRDLVLQDFITTHRQFVMHFVVVVRLNARLCHASDQSSLAVFAKFSLQTLLFTRGAEWLLFRLIWFWGMAIAILLSLQRLPPYQGNDIRRRTANTKGCDAKILEYLTTMNS